MARPPHRFAAHDLLERGGQITVSQNADSNRSRSRRRPFDKPGEVVNIRGFDVCLQSELSAAAAADASETAVRAASKTIRGPRRAFADLRQNLIAITQNRQVLFKYTPRFT